VASVEATPGSEVDLFDAVVSGNAALRSSVDADRGIADRIDGALVGGALAVIGDSDGRVNCNSSLVARFNQFEGI
jgi:hypothetical protein